MQTGLLKWLCVFIQTLKGWKNMDNYIMIDGKKIPLTDEQVKMLKGTQEAKKSPFERLKCVERYYFIDAKGNVGSTDEFCADADNDLYGVANYCADKKLMEQRALHETLNRLLWRFSMENGEGENPWTSDCAHWYIFYAHNIDEFRITWVEKVHSAGTIYFSSGELAQRAIVEIIKPFIKEHPDFVW